MAFNAANLTQDSTTYVVFNPNNLRGQFVWNYSTADNLSTVESGNETDTGYFSPDGWKYLRRFDILRVTAGDGNRLYMVDVSSYNAGDPVVGLISLASDVDTF